MPTTITAPRHINQVRTYLDFLRWIFSTPRSVGKNGEGWPLIWGCQIFVLKTTHSSIACQPTGICQAWAVAPRACVPPRQPRCHQCLMLAIHAGQAQFVQHSQAYRMHCSGAQPTFLPGSLPRLHGTKKKHTWEPKITKKKINKKR